MKEVDEKRAAIAAAAKAGAGKGNKAKNRPQTAQQPKAQQAEEETKVEEEVELTKKQAKKANERQVPGGWDVTQQKQMENGMKMYPSTMGAKERWVKIASMVDGQDAKSCYAQFKSICAQVK